MTTALVLSAALVAVVAAARSTWSPCGLSMMSSITPFGERSRGHRYWATATWFALGGLVGGATLGLVALLPAWALSLAGLSHHAGLVAAIGAPCALAAALVDAGAFGDVLPVLRRQVDDRWLARYRPWVYGAGFGWQIGVGVATYVMTAGVFLLVVLAALTASPLAAVALCAGFGLARGLTVFLTARADNPAHLRKVHARIDRLGPAVRWSAVGIEILAGCVISAEVWWPASLLVAVVFAAGVVRALRPAVIRR